jgi:hypothetical protein
MDWATFWAIYPQTHWVISPIFSHEHSACRYVEIGQQLWITQFFSSARIFIRSNQKMLQGRRTTQSLAPPETLESDASRADTWILSRQGANSRIHKSGTDVMIF